jgi:hypothetical protein
MDYHNWELKDNDQVKSQKRYSKTKSLYITLVIFYRAYNLL